MRKPRPVTPRTETVSAQTDTVHDVPQPSRRRLALEAENAKLNALAGVRISWIH